MKPSAIDIDLINLMKKELSDLDMHIQAFLNDLKQTQRYTVNTQMAYASDLQHFIKFLAVFLDSVPNLSDINPMTIREYINFERESGLSPNTLYRRQITINKFQNFFKNNGHVGVHTQEHKLIPLRCQLYLQKKQPHQVDIIQQDDADRLLAAMDTARVPHSTRDQAIFTLMLAAGLPVHRLVTLNLTDFNAPSGQILPKKGLKKWLSLGTPAVYIERYISSGRPELNPRSEEDALFISQMGYRLSRQGIWQIIEHWGRMIQPPIHVSPRKLRNTAAAKLINSGRPLEEIQLLLGHKNPLSTLALWRRLKHAGLLALEIEPDII